MKMIKSPVIIMGLLFFVLCASTAFPNRETGEEPAPTGKPAPAGKPEEVKAVEDKKPGPVIGNPVVNRLSPIPAGYPTGYPVTDFRSYPAGVGKRYYLDSLLGSDNAEGTKEKPWKSIKKVLSVAAGGDTVMLAPGSYGVFVENGTAGRKDWLTFQATQTGKAVFEGIILKYSTLTDSNIRFDGIALQFSKNSAVEADNARNIEFRNMKITGENKYLADRGFRIYNSENILIYRTEIFNTFRGLTLLGCSNITVSTGYIHGLGGGTGIQHAGGNRNALLERNNIDGSTYDPKDEHAPKNPHGSGISIRSNNLYIRENIVHNIGSSSGMMFYDVDAAGGEEVYGNIYIENNLFYDIHNPFVLRMDNLGKDVVLQNNTFIGKLRNDKNNGSFKLNTAVTVHRLAEGYDGSGLKVYNNVFMGMVSLPEKSDIRGNIFWSFYYFERQFKFLCDLKDKKTRVITCSGDFPVEYVKKGFFKGAPDLNEKHGLNLDFRLMKGSEAVNFGDPAYQSAVSLGPVGEDGFILPGQVRSSKAHSAGCYEYGE